LSIIDIIESAIGNASCNSRKTSEAVAWRMGKGKFRDEGAPTKDEDELVGSGDGE
jgi:hypothetical protein